MRRDDERANVRRHDASSSSRENRTRIRAFARHGARAIACGSRDRVVERWSDAHGVVDARAWA